MTDVSTYKLGRRKPTDVQRALLARLPDAANLALRIENFQPPPLARYWSSTDGTPYGTRRRVSMFGNDRLGDCTVATLAHQDQIAAQAVGETSPLEDDDVIAIYRQSGYDPADPSSDQGWGNLDAARAAVRAGWASALVHFDATDRDMLEIVVNTFGCAMVGIDLPLSAQRQTGLGKTWDAPPDGKLDGEHRPSSWGGHAVGVVDCDAEGVTVATWGAYQRATWAFVANYFDRGDGIALLNRYWRKHPLSPSGLYVAEIETEMEKIGLSRWV